MTGSAVKLFSVGRKHDVRLRCCDTCVCGVYGMKTSRNAINRRQHKVFFHSL